ncbi:PAS domain-containing protein [Oceanihabitans sp. 2_MG-2023]|uniref:PAS domain-containing sensor histidine kinase n=1 Tax=Oceanihabitans sp. 2_MG-2023 TaxID=3062661 RepID=UPI0026E282F1|nr:sensor histidine kinase [Oceanihabitans sp. 2_MG-2023]MDO6597523.1 PAS domain-containing protein [Oceanihabitans sp. 2_MG-2023]
MKTTLTSNQDISNIVDYDSKLILEEFVSKFALENSNIGVWDFNVINKTVNYSKEAKQILDLKNTDHNAETYNWQEKVHPDDLDNVIENLLNHLNYKTPNYISEHRILISNGSYKWIKDIGKVVKRDENGNHTRMIGTTIDISERKKQEAKLIEKNNIIKDQNTKLKNFALIVSHNLKSHTANFESLLSFHDETEDEDEKKDIINHLKTVNNSLSKTISNLNKIVNVSNSKNKSLQTINLNNIVKNTLELLAVKIISSNTIINNQIDSDLYLEFNLSYLESIIQNLLTNAIKYKHPERNPIINISSEKTNEHIIITFSDNGLGIDLDKFGDAIFGLYRTFHKNANSEGVGLYLIKSQIEAFNGTIDVTSTVNVGTTFNIKLPNKKV